MYHCFEEYFSAAYAIPLNVVLLRNEITLLMQIYIWNPKLYRTNYTYFTFWLCIVRFESMSFPAPMQRYVDVKRNYYSCSAFREEIPHFFFAYWVSYEIERIQFYSSICICLNVLYAFYFHCCCWISSKRKPALTIGALTFVFNVLQTCSIL